ncbi:MAG: PorV/PorQ family protein [bacterium]|nr:PorV/PorQ family protein [bacterium]
MLKKLSLVVILVGGMMLVSGGMAIAVDGEGAGPFLKLGAGARATGMSDAFVAVADDATAAYWNPAGLAQLSSREFTSMYSDLGLDRQFNFLNYAHPIGKGAVGVSWVNSGVKDYTLRTGPDPEDIIGTGDMGYNMFIFSYGRNLGSKLSLGVNGKFLAEKMDDVNGNEKSADGIGWDVGLLASPIERFSFGVMLADLGISNLEWDSGKEDAVPMKLKAGLAYRPLKRNGLLLAAGFVRNFDQDITRLDMGTEYKIIADLALRAGVSLNRGNDEDYTEFGAGIGYNLVLSPDFEVQLDYSYDNVDNDLSSEDGHRVSLTVRF